MAFTPASNRTPSAIGQIGHLLIDDTSDSLRFYLEVLDQNGDAGWTRAGNEVPHLDSAQITQLQNFVATQRPKIEALASGPVGRIVHIVRDVDGVTYTIRYTARVSGGSDISGDELAIMTSGQISALEAFMAAQRAKAMSQILP